MRTTDMAVVISQSQNEIADMAERGLDIRPHRKRMVEEELEDKFKDPQDPFRIAFVCSMWTTGFDVPSLSTVYLDKPLRNHTLMQTITRANRVFPEKNNGLIVAYVDVFRNLQRAWRSTRSGASPATCRWRRRARSLTPLREAVDDLRAFCAERDVDLDALGPPEGVRAGRGRQADGRDADGRRRREGRVPVARRAGRSPLQGDPARQAGQRVQPVRAVSKFLADAHRRLHRAARRLRRHGAESSSSSTSPSPPRST